MQITGDLRKMRATLESPVQYELPLGEDALHMNDLIGKSFSLNWIGEIYCKRCGRKTKKSFLQGFCFPCFRDAPEASPCIIHPEQCEGHLGKGRDVEWEKANHVQPHVVYLALTSGVKVGVTRSTQIPTRWIDQGAWQVMVLADLPYRQLAGALEVAMKEHLTDKTAWQRMLKNQMATDVDLRAEKKRVTALVPEEFQSYLSDNEELTEIIYPVTKYPTKVKSLNLDKTPEVNGKLLGIRGQYLMFEDNTVINIRKYAGYRVTISA
ncbi:MAG: DUF2797 domain-containing protein [Bacteroidota bacterium]